MCEDAEFFARKLYAYGNARGECRWRCAESDCMNAQVRNFRAKFCAKFRENRTFRIRTLYRLREIRTLWHTAQDTLVPGPGHYGARHSLRVSGAAAWGRCVQCKAAVRPTPLFVGYGAGVHALRQSHAVGPLASDGALHVALPPGFGLCSLCCS